MDDRCGGVGARLSAVGAVVAMWALGTLARALGAILRVLRHG